MQAEVMDSRGPQAYFDTPERAERLQLVAHLVRNADAVPYVRGPKGAGKTRFAERLASIFRQEATLVELDGQAVPDVPAMVHQALGVAGEWPAAALDAVGDGELVVMVDNADRLDAAGMGALYALRKAGGRLVMLGASDPAQLSGQWNIQLIDLPPFSERQAREFLNFLDAAEGAMLKDSELARLHRLAKGQPGQIIDVLRGELASSGYWLGRVLPWKWLLGGSAALLVALVLWQQDAINALFQPVTPPPEAPPSTAPVVQTEPGQPIAIPPMGSEKPAPMTPPDVETATPSVAAEPEPEPAVAVASPQPATMAAAPEADGAAPVVSLQQTPPATQVPAPVESTPEHAHAAAQEAESKAAVVAAGRAVPTEPVKPPAVAGTTLKPAIDTGSGPDDLAWLRSRPGAHYTLQLLGARSREPIDLVIRDHRLPGRYAVFTRNLGGKPWHSLVYGDFPDREAALRALDNLPVDLRANEVWPRTFSSIWEQLPDAAVTH